MKLKQLEYRDIALKQLKSHVFYLLNEDNRRQKIIFKAPTGSGKTVTMACLLRDLVNELPLNYEVANKEVAYIWIAPNALHLQSYRSLQNFYQETRDIRTIQFEDIDDDRLNPNEMLFVNWQSVSSDDNIYVRETETDKSLYTFIANTKQQGTEIILILDEAHLFGTRGEKAQKVLANIDAKIEIDVTATPHIRSDYEVTIRRADVVKEQMIKKGVNLNPKLTAVVQNGRDADLLLLQQALEKRAELAGKYKAAGTNINPLLLIQLPSDTQKITAADDSIKQLVVEYLQIQGVTEQNHRLAIWLSNEKINLNDISQNDGVVDVLLFKQAIAMGWDCPRAAVLLVYRDMKQVTFTVQTLGRILRMPEQRHYTDDSLNIGYVYTNLERNLIEIISDEMDYLTFNKSVRKPIYRNLSLASYYKESTLSRNRIGLHFKEALFVTSEKMLGLVPIATADQSHYVINKQSLAARFIETNIEEIEIAIPVDMMIDVTHEGEIEVTKSAKFAKTTYQLEQLFNRFCLSNCGDYQKDGSWERIKHHMKLLFEEYLGLEEKAMYKIVLHNQQKFTDILNVAREEYGRIMETKASTKTMEVKQYEWEVPEFRIYNDNYVEHDVDKAILDPLFLKKNAGFLSDSKNEFDFINFLEQHRNHIVWWYKNGVGSKTDFSVPYINAKNQTALFFVDIIILFSNGTLGLFDPKTANSDIDMVAKHNELNKYVKARNSIGKATIGGIVLPEQGSWRYSMGEIKNGYDVTEWEVFNPSFIL